MIHRYDLDVDNNSEQASDLCTEVVRFLEGPLLEVLLYFWCVMYGLVFQYM